MRLNKEDLLLYAITDRHWLKEGQSLVSEVEKALKGGASFIQLREKTLCEEDFLKEAIELKALCKDRVPFVINDNVRIAKEVDADGVHIGQGDMDAKSARKLLGEDKIIGVSAQTVEQALKAQADGADYLGVGAVFPTSSKDDATEVDRKTLEAICSSVDIPVIAIGGITMENTIELAGSGICGISVISAIFASEDIEETTRNLRKITEEMVGK